MPKIVGVGKTDVGLYRLKNEDTFIARPDLGLFTVADGMGGQKGGEVASRFFSETVLEVFSNNENESLKDLRNSIQNAFKLSNEKIFYDGHENPQHQGMGCTAELIVFYKKRYFLGHVGDSRIYLYRKGELNQLTRDHSLVQEQLDKGLCTPDQAKELPYRNVILRAVGTTDALEIDMLENEIYDNDLFLLCSDGLTDMLDDNIIKEVLSYPSNLDDKVERLIDLAKSAGGFDNITVILAEIVRSD